MKYELGNTYQRTGVSLIPTSAIYLYALAKNLQNLQIIKEV